MSDTSTWRGARLVSLLAAVLGLAVSVYLTAEHFDTSISLACPESATINCAKVTTSQWSVIAGVPVALLGLIYFAVMAALLALPSRLPSLGLVRTLGAAGGLLMVLYLVYIELFRVDAICLWCTAVHALTVIMFGAVLWHALSMNDSAPSSVSDQSGCSHPTPSRSRR